MIDLSNRIQKLDYWKGIVLQPRKVTPNQATEHIHTFGTEYMFIMLLS